MTYYNDFDQNIIFHIHIKEHSMQLPSKEFDLNQYTKMQNLPQIFHGPIDESKLIPTKVGKQCI